MLRDKTLVPHPDNMEHETFLLHYDKRHLKDIGLRTPLRSGQTKRAAASLRAFHRRCHELNPFGYDHEHKEYE